LKSGGLVVANGKKGQLYQKEAANSRDANATKYGLTLLHPSREAHIEVRRSGSYFSIFAVARRPARIAGRLTSNESLHGQLCRSSIS
jgi:hypothetical protein